MKVHVNNEIGREINPHYKFENTDMEEENLHEAVGNLRYDKFEANVKSYPAPGIPNGTRECELVWQVKTQTGWEEISYLGYNNRRKANEFQVRPQYNLRQVFVLSPLKEQGERSGVITAADFFNDHTLDMDGNNVVTSSIIVIVMQEYATQVAEAVR